MNHQAIYKVAGGDFGIPDLNAASSSALASLAWLARISMSGSSTSRVAQRPLNRPITRITNMKLSGIFFIFRPPFSRTPSSASFSFCFLRCSKNSFDSFFRCRNAARVSKKVGEELHAPLGRSIVLRILIPKVFEALGGCHHVHVCQCHHQRPVGEQLVTLQPHHPAPIQKHRLSLAIWREPKE
mmetsp:Transcript_10028/g.26074  ORF Transcript_10028/g.26074 Transcript_10028/m.26074 type:complete len:184 (-) Transcript_10028:640-1191(-)